MGILSESWLTLVDPQLLPSLFATVPYAFLLRQKGKWKVIRALPFTQRCGHVQFYPSPLMPTPWASITHKSS